MSNVIIYHNPRCSKSRQTLALIEGKGITPAIVEYLKQPPTVAELKELLTKLNLSPHKLIRKKEQAYTELNLSEKNSEASLLKAMVLHPVLIERPIVVKGNKACLGRPPENVLEIL